MEISSFTLFTIDIYIPLPIRINFRPPNFETVHDGMNEPSRAAKYKWKEVDGKEERRGWRAKIESRKCNANNFQVYMKKIDE